MKSFAVIGLGLFGTKLAGELFEAGHNVLVIDTNEKKIDAIADHVSRAVVLDAKDRDALSHLGISRYDCVVVCTTNDLANTVLITMNLKALNVPQIVCKVLNEQDEEVLKTLGASFCLIPEHIGAVNLSHKLNSKNVLDFTQLSAHHSIVEILVPKDWVGRSLRELEIRAKHGVNIIAIRRNNLLQVDFDPSEPLLESDILFVIGSNKKLMKIQKID